MVLSMAAPAIVSAASGPAKTASIGTPAHPLRPLARCLDPNAITSWQALGNDAMLINSMRGRFLIKVNPLCAALLFSPTVHFRAPFSGMLCGNQGEAVVTQGEACSIIRIERLDKARYEMLMRGTHKPKAAPVPHRGPAP